MVGATDTCVISSSQYITHDKVTNIGRQNIRIIVKRMIYYDYLTKGTDPGFRKGGPSGV